MSDREELARLIALGVDDTSRKDYEERCSQDYRNEMLEGADAILASDWLRKRDKQIVRQASILAREETKAGIAEAIEAFCYLREDGDHPCDAELHADIAREWEGS